MFIARQYSFAPNTLNDDCSALCQVVVFLCKLLEISLEIGEQACEAALVLVKALLSEPEFLTLELVQQGFEATGKNMPEVSISSNF